jgi:regulatory protein
MEEIHDSDYRKTLLKLAQKKWSSLKGPDSTDYVKSSKTTNFLLQRGFERSLIASAINTIKEKKT